MNADSAHTLADRERSQRRPLPVVEVLAGLLLVAVLSRSWLSPLFDDPAVQTWLTVFISITVQAMPFLVLGVVIAGALTALAPQDAFARILPRRTVLSVPVAGIAGVALPGCECGSVPIAGRMIGRGAPAAAAVTFLLAAPAINPVVIAATLVAFPAQPEMAAGRFGASLVTAIVVGLIWSRIGRDEWVARARRRKVVGGSRWDIFRSTASHDFVHAGSFLVIGAATAAVLQVVIPREVLDTLAGTGVVAILTLAVLAVIMAICSEADAFVAAGLTQFSMTSRLVFLVVGPAVDVKLVALQSGTFGRSFAMRFAPLTFVVAVTVAVFFGWLLL